MSTNKPLIPAYKAIGDFAPKLVELTDVVRRRLGAAAALEARPELDHLRGARGDWQDRADDLPLPARDRKRRHAGRARRTHHPPRVLRGLAQCDVGHGSRQGDAREKVGDDPRADGHAGKRPLGSQKMSQLGWLKLYQPTEGSWGCAARQRCHRRPPWTERRSWPSNSSQMSREREGNRFLLRPEIGSWT